MASSLLAELAELRQTAPAEIEPELEDGDASAWATTSSAAPTRRLRRLDEDPKYQGRRVSRRQLENDDGLFLDGSSTAASKKGRRGMNSGRGQEDGDESDSEEEDGSASEEESDSEEESASEAVSEDDEDDDNEGPAETGKAARARAMLGGGGPDSSEAARMAREFEELEQEEVSLPLTMRLEIRFVAARHCKPCSSIAHVSYLSSPPQTLLGCSSAATVDRRLCTGGKGTARKEPACAVGGADGAAHSHATRRCAV